MSTALIIGYQGQDGTLLRAQLAERGYSCFGVGRRAAALGEFGGSEPIDVADAEQVSALVGRCRPDEIYYLAAHHGPAESRAGGSDSLRRSFVVNVTGLGHFLEAIRTRSPATRLFYAASSHVFGVPDRQPQDETTPISPTSLYGVTKAAGLFLCRHFRREHGVFAAAGILYNHESPLRPPQFVTSKIVDAALRIRQGVQRELVLGELDASVDWGSAVEYVDAMWRILQLPTADEFVIATGRSHTVRDFARTAFGQLGLDWRACVREDPALTRTAVTGAVPLVGNAERLRRLTGWEPRMGLDELVAWLLAGRGAGAVPTGSHG